MKLRLSTLLIFTLLFSSFGFAQLRMSKGSQKIATTIALIEGLYVDKVDEDKLAEDAVKSILKQLDPHSTYISPEEVSDMNEPLEGEFDGIGIAFNMMTDTIYVIETIPGGPSEKIGLRAGDKIIYINDTIIAGQKHTNKYVMSRLKGKKGTTVDVKVLRKGENDLLNFRIKRDKIPMHSLDAAYMLDSKVGYIKISRFGATTTQEFIDATKKLKLEGMKDLILDLEYNGGGYLSAAIDLSDEFLTRDKLIVYTEGSRAPKSEAKSTSKGGFETGKLVILINEASASASEIVSGAVQDWDRGVIVGRRSFGKGLVQRQFPLPDNSMMRLTVARYYTPTGRCIQKPYTNGDKESYDMDMVKRINNGELSHADSIHFPDSLRYQTLTHERTVYGGGGIMPDYYVPIDTAWFTEYGRKLLDRGLTYKVAYSEVDNNRHLLKKEFPTAELFYKNYEVTESVFQKLIEEGNKEKVEYDEEQFNTSKKVLSMQIKALLARDLYDTTTQIRIINDNSDIYHKAYEIIRDDKQYETLLGIRKK